jgi:hypothetical protein
VTVMKVQPRLLVKALCAGGLAARDVTHVASRVPEKSWPTAQRLP